MTPRSPLKLLPLIFLLLAGCSDEVIPAICSGDPPCPPPSALLKWAAQLWPASAQQNRSPQATPLPQDEPQVVFDGEGTARLRFIQSAQISGTVLDERGQALAKARVVAILPSAIPGQSPKSFESSTGPTGTFSLRVPVPRKPAEQLYRIWVGFDDTEQAAQRPSIWRNDVYVIGDMQLTLQARPVAELATIRGNITDIFGNGMGGLRVQVVDSSRVVMSSTALSKEAAQGGDRIGAFQLLVDPKLSSDERLQLVAWPGRQMGDVPVLAQPLSRLKAGDSVALDFRLPPYRKPLPFTLVVRGTGTSGETKTAGGAKVQAQVFLSDPLPETAQTATYVVSGETDAQGQVTLPLVPATGQNNLQYTITVQSPPQSELASAVLPVQVGEKEGVVYLALPQRAQLSGLLADSAGAGVASAQVFARNISGDGSGLSLTGGVLIESIVPQTTTDQDGHFALLLDPGDYDLDLVPVPGTLPRYSVDNQRILTDDLKLGLIRLPRPTLGRMQVMGPDGYPVVGARVRLFQLPDTTPRLGGACDLLLPCSRNAKLRAEALTDSKGRAQLLLPDAAQAP